MASYVITGGKPLSGSIEISGNKNAALPCLAATLLTDEPVILKNIPEIEDVGAMLMLLESLGSEIETLDRHKIKITGNRKNSLPLESLPVEIVDSIRASILLAGPLAVRAKYVSLPPPGGDVIGYRRLDTHFLGLEALGCTCTITPEGRLEVVAGKLKGTTIFLDEASVTATENVLMASVLCEGITVISNAACEPHVQDLCNMLVAMGANISGIGSNLLTIEGVATLSGCTFTIGSDYMEVGSYIGLAAATGGELELKGVNIKHLPMIQMGFKRIGVEWIKNGPDSIIVPTVQSRVIKRALDGGTSKIDDAPWPGFPADLLSIITVVSTQMKGTILIHEKMYETRMFFIDWLVRMGADIILCDPHRAVINGPSRLKGANLTSPDVRAGMALVIAALCADGVSTIQNIYQIERGYERLEEKLLGVGALITRVR
ncbi:MAG: UDP-N-acetylglucosamine 1-carboxyvinyltransferase [Sphaerochaetaceae bacterium]|jgi:UDP-N-acetylglucosamine 1-carboxyvinyltransferase|nr:UDP-N-acetylglucosamine 1-carboxyvinyltransferase [Sphaerochaetaceae bacterium]NLO60212.1 UDP-N-acetylglucosamine 1-carboxyvinyltransferase [Spirochaetales bacterium]MDD2405289.1 UDP-N-acetylglucosamine 1-carboxyvinyltransferase [Sphaerochaetaceae bacterium]MDD3670356.1 UDP-N-acetylglucosamine 1-carboxyvinyltransferase [Sphaerochaetaceae bacterium]MDD4258445.1 UDP-N-acetylglucosamine 1-carboxyvinyltransferase [Sphaerochaetaceae bacterium]